MTGGVGEARRVGAPEPSSDDVNDVGSCDQRFGLNEQLLLLSPSNSPLLFSAPSQSIPLETCRKTTYALFSPLLMINRRSADVLRAASCAFANLQRRLQLPVSLLQKQDLLRLLVHTLRFCHILLTSSAAPSSVFSELFRY